MERKYQRKIKAKPDPSGRLCHARASPIVAAHSFLAGCVKLFLQQA